MDNIWLGSRKQTLECAYYHGHNGRLTRGSESEMSASLLLLSVEPVWSTKNSAPSVRPASVA